MVNGTVRLAMRTESVRARPCRDQRIVAAAVLAALGIGAFEASFAAEGDTGSAAGLEEVVVTARKQQEQLQDVPMAISAVSGESLLGRQVTNVVDMQGNLPNVNFAVRASIGAPTIRGVGLSILAAGASANVATHEDGVYIGRPSATAASFFDVDRIEVLRGPQGTLYGRNATGGAINIITRDPTADPQGHANLTLGNHNSKRLEVAMGGGMVEDRLMGRVAGVIESHDGWATNHFSGEPVDTLDMSAFRGKLKYLLSDAWTVELAGEIYHQDDTLTTYKYLGQPAAVAPLFGVIRGGAAWPTESRDIDGELEPVNQLDLESLTATVSWDGGDAYAFKSITGYRTTDFYWQTDIDGTSWQVFNITREEASHQFSQEFQLTYQGAKFNWLAGLYYYDDANAVNVRAPGGFAATPVLNLAFHQSATLQNRAYAAFAEGTYHFTDAWAVTVGVRYSDETVEIIDERYDRAPLPSLVRNCAAIACSLDENDTSPRFILTYTPVENATLYASASRGFKSGGFATGAIQPPFRSEHVTSYETGAKLTWLAGRVRSNFSAFYYDYKDMQQTKVLSGVTTTENAASSTIQGFEAEVQALVTDALQLDLTLGLLDAKFDEFDSQNPIYPGSLPADLSDNRVPLTPRYNASIAATYTWSVPSGKLALRAEASFSDEMWFDAFNQQPVYQPSYGMGNAFLTYQLDRGLSVGAFVRNLTDELVLSSAYVSNSTGPTGLGTYLPPRTYGLTIGYRL